MPETFLHGIEVVEIDSGPRPIQTVKSSVIGIVGTAPDADAEAFPINTPVLVAGSQLEAAKLDLAGAGEGTLPEAMDGMFDQGVGPMAVVVRVEEDASLPQTISNVIGGVDPDTGAYSGLHALLGARSAVKVVPRILLAPGFTSYVTRDVGGLIEGAPVATEMLGIAERLRAVCLFDGPNTNDAEAITFRELFGSRRAYVTDPWVKVWDTAASAVALQPASARVAGILAKSDKERGFWWSPSNREMLGIVGTARPVDFAVDDPNCRANYLNENEVATIVHQDGYRQWGNRTCSSDQKWAFLSVVRTADMLHESLVVNHLWAVDRNITKTYFEEVREGVRAYIRHLMAVGALIGGDCWLDAKLNTPERIASGEAYWDFDFTPPYPSEHLTFRSHLVNDYLLSLLAA